MATGNRDRVRNFYSIKNGKVVLTLGKEQPGVMDGVTKRVNKNGDTVYEIVSDYVRGKIKSMEIKPAPENTDFKDQIKLVMVDSEGEKFSVEFPFDSAYGRGFLYVLDSVDFNAAVELEPYKFTDKKTGRDKMGVQVFQFGERLDWTMGTKKNPGGVPALKKVKYKGKESWDNTEQLEFLTKFFAKKCDHLAEATKPQAEEALDATVVDEGEGDLPF